MKPPVEAPASRARRPSTRSPRGTNAASAPASLCPPRETYSGSSSSGRTTTAALVSTCVAGLAAVVPPTVTRPAAMSWLACSRERASLRRTSSASSRRRGTCQLRGYGRPGTPRPGTGPEAWPGTGPGAGRSRAVRVSRRPRCTSSYTSVWPETARWSASSRRLNWASTGACPVGSTCRPSGRGPSSSSSGPCSSASSASEGGPSAASPVACPSTGRAGPASPGGPDPSPAGAGGAVCREKSAGSDGPACCCAGAGNSRDPGNRAGTASAASPASRVPHVPVLLRRHFARHRLAHTPDATAFDLRPGPRPYARGSFLPQRARTVPRGGHHQRRTRSPDRRSPGRACRRPPRRAAP